MKTMTTVHVIPSFHYDVAFRKTFRQYLPACLDNLKAALALLEKHKDYTYCVEQTILLREYWKRHPADRKKIAEFARQGRLYCAPGMFTMPDVNIPSGESFIRNAAIGRDWLKKHLGITPDCCWMADIFGHHPAMPQLAATCGFGSYMFERGKSGSWNTTFRWEGIDGTRLDSHWEIDTYYGVMIAMAWMRDRDKAWVEARMEKEVLGPLRRHSPNPNILISPLGGDFLKPSEDHIRFVRAWNREHPDVHLKFSTPKAYFDALAAAKTVIPVERIDLAPLCEGCNSSRIRLKQYNRRLEEKAATLEALETLARTPHRESGALWETLAWNAFHDIICGTLVKPAYFEALAKYAAAEKRADRAINALARKTAGTESASPKAAGTPRRWFNSLPYARREIVEHKGKFGEVVLPPLGFAAARWTPPSDRVTFSPKTRCLENGRLRAVFAPNGTIISLFDKESGEDLADPSDGMNNFKHLADCGDPWTVDGRINSGLLRNAPNFLPVPASGVVLAREGRCDARAADAECHAYPEMKVMENDPRRIALEFHYEHMRYRTRVALGSGEKMLRIGSRFMPKGGRYRLLATFPTSIRKGKIRHSTPCGHVYRPEGEYASQGWMDYRDGKKGILLVNKGLPGNNVSGNTLVLSLFRAVSMENADRKPYYEEGVEQAFEYGLMPFAAGDREYHPARTAALFNREVVAVDGAVPDAAAKPLVELRGDNAELSCLKREGDRLVVRLWESRGRKGVVRLAFDGKIAEAMRTNAVGEHRAPVDFKGNAVSLKLRPFEIATLELHLVNSL